MGHEYSMTVREAAEFVRDVGMGDLHGYPETPNDTPWLVCYREAIMLLDDALRTEGQPEPPNHYSHGIFAPGMR